MSSLNEVTLIGRLGKNPETRMTENSQVSNFSLATTEYYKDRSGQKQESTEWHNIALWAKLSEIADKYLSKGSLVCIKGRLKTRSWDDKDGNKKYITEVIGNSLIMLGSKNEKPSQSKAVEDAHVVEFSDDNESGLHF